ncbi:hypothetical protein BDF19DRAFT_448116 [Syncephalis fuscata]|nr:hypothetical protein BDF19DRAFT_448116 [Syncephalis fuscata]
MNLQKHTSTRREMNQRNEERGKVADSWSVCWSALNHFAILFGAVLLLLGAMIVGDLSPIATMVNSELAVLLVGLGAYGFILGFVGYRQQHNEQQQRQQHDQYRNRQYLQPLTTLRHLNSTELNSHTNHSGNRRHITGLFGHILLYTLLLWVGLQAIYYIPGIHKELSTAWTSEYALHPDALQELERKLNCCGYNSLYDRAVPSTCAAVMNRLNPCQPRIYALWNESLYAIAIISLSIVGLEVSLLPFTITSTFNLM